MIFFIIAMFLCGALFFVLMWREFVLYDETHYVYRFLWIVFSLMFGFNLAIYIILQEKEMKNIKYLMKKYGIEQVENFDKLEDEG